VFFFEHQIHIHDPRRGAWHVDWEGY